MAKKQHHDEHIDESWLLPYSDMMTLLLALFIVMFAMSKVDNQKMKQLSQEFNIIFQGGKGALKGSGENSAVELPISDPAEIQKREGIIEQDKMVVLKNILEGQIKENGYAEQIKIDLNGDGLDISIQDAAAFNSGEADILDKFNHVLLQIADRLRDLDNEIRVSGHTDNVPIKNKKFRSNWDLSYMRASNVMNFLIDSGHMIPNKFSVQSYGEYSPKYDNLTEEGRAGNRRVEIIVVRKYPLGTKE